MATKTKQRLSILNLMFIKWDLYEQFSITGSPFFMSSYDTVCYVSKYAVIAHGSIKMCRTFLLSRNNLVNSTCVYTYLAIYTGFIHMNGYAGSRDYLGTLQSSAETARSVRNSETRRTPSYAICISCNIILLRTSNINMKLF